MPPVTSRAWPLQPRTKTPFGELSAPLTEAERADVAPLAREIVAALVLRGIDAARHLGPMLPLADGTPPVTEIRKLARARGTSPTTWMSRFAGGSERLQPIVDYLLEDVGGARACPWFAGCPRWHDPAAGRSRLHDRDARGDGVATGRRSHRRGPDLAEVEVWRLFEVEGGGEDSLATHEKFHGDGLGDGVPVDGCC